MYCPIRNTWKPKCTEKCMHNVEGECLYKENSSLADLPERVRISEISKRHNVSVKEITRAMSEIRATIVADAFADFILGKSLLDIDVSSFSTKINEAAFDRWNRTDVSFADMQLALFNLIERSKHESSNSTRSAAVEERASVGSQQQP